MRGPVVVDTGVLAVEPVRSRELADLCAPEHEGRRFMVSFLTVAEVRYGGPSIGACGYRCFEAPPSTPKELAKTKP